MNSHRFFVLSTLAELPIGILLLFVPSFMSRQLLGVNPGSEFEMTILRIAGVAILSLAIACWRSRSEMQGGRPSPVISGMLCYNLLVGILLIMYGINVVSTVLLNVAILVHALLFLVCLYLLNKSRRMTN